VVSIFCAVDTPDLEQATRLAGLMAAAGCGIKLGLEFFVSQGPAGLAHIRACYPDLPVFLDLKFHDIPNTAAHAARAATSLGITYMTLHASGGLEMMKMTKAAVEEEAIKQGIPTPKLLAVTVLTSLDEQGLNAVGQQTPVSAQVERLAQLAKEAGLAGVVCSAHEIAQLRSKLGPNFVLMVPGIRPKGSETGDQKRIMTPEEAMKLGATHLVIGRPITGAESPEEKVKMSQPL
jgi:orotidine-5'-phosphate decarboxylase